MPRLVQSYETGSSLTEHAVRLGKLLSRVAPVPDDWLDQNVKLTTTRCTSWSEVESSWRSCQRWRRGLSDMLVTMLAVAASTSQTGNQLHLLVVAAAGSSKCLGKGTPILMWDGSIKPVEDVVVGDLVMGPDSCPRGVVSLGRGREQMYRVIPVKGDSYVVNESHILSLKMHKDGRDDKRSLKFKNEHKGEHVTVNISLKQYMKLTEGCKKKFKGWRTAIDWDEQHVSVDPYFLGLWLGDGNSSGPVITTADNEIETYLRAQCFKLGLTLKKVKQGISHEGSNCASFHLSTGEKSFYQQNILLAALRKLNVIKNKHIPETYKINSREVRLQLLAGLIDSDGCHSSGYMIYSTILPKLAEDVTFLCRSLGFAAYVTKRTSVCTNSKTKAVCEYYAVSISGDCSVIPVLLSRKKAHKRQQVKNVLHTGLTIEKLGVDDYYGFTVTDDGLFVLGDFTVTHNTVLCDAMLTSRRCVVVEHITGFHSGVMSDDGRDLSFLARANHLTWITPEGDVLVSSPQFSDLMSQARRIFDGKSSAIYKNTDEDKSFEGLRTPWIIAGTPFMLDYWDQSRLGDRFIRVCLDEPQRDERRNIVLSAIDNEWSAVAEHSNGQSGGVEPRLRQAYSLTGGYVDWLRDNAHKIDEINIDESIKYSIADYAEFTADMRTRPNMDPRKLSDHDSKELPTRLARQFIRLARCCAFVLNKKIVDAEVLRIVRSRAVDTSRGKTLDVLQWFRAVNPRTGKIFQDDGGLMAMQIARWAAFKSDSDCSSYLKFLHKMDIIEQVEHQHSHGYWKMTQRVAELCKIVLQ